MINLKRHAHKVILNNIRIDISHNIYTISGTNAILLYFFLQIKYNEYIKLNYLQK